MIEARHLLSFVTNSDGSMVSIHADLAGIDLLIHELNVLRDDLLTNDCPHTHLFSSPPNAPQLTKTQLENQDMEVTCVDHVKIYGWNAEWAARHGLSPRTKPDGG
ncbi:hypothetical protein K227x_27510 [Rubripirellula lacrimiformis]|uniref:Uncharacterized protein n=1 Tax=Rubripirellula lacrimiformis TaxID=1930273 RepID=A0A517NB56_9BACT|nr:hypothetical protein K227x_27510 [Rubripirellula lacrimiformis]